MISSDAGFLTSPSDPLMDSGEPSESATVGVVAELLAPGETMGEGGTGHMNHTVSANAAPTMASTNKFGRAVLLIEFGSG